MTKNNLKSLTNVYIDLHVELVILNNNQLPELCKFVYVFFCRRHLSHLIIICYNNTTNLSIVDKKYLRLPFAWKYFYIRTHLLIKAE